eukprot:3014487-Pyramimonas_sp.AAC.1
MDCQPSPAPSHPHHLGANGQALPAVTATAQGSACSWAAVNHHPLPHADGMGPDKTEPAAHPRRPYRRQRRLG